MFEASRQKVWRAKRHSNELKSELDAFKATNPAKFTTTKNEIDKGFLFEFKFDINPIPPHISPILGDIFHNLRASLDLLASEAISARGGSVDGVAFPFAKDEPSLLHQVQQRKFFFLGDKAISLLTKLKPRRDGDVDLWAVHEMNVQDKHKAIIVAAVQVTTPVIDTWTMQIVGDPDAASSFQFVFPISSPLANREVHSTLEAITSKVDAIISEFENIL